MSELGEHTPNLNMTGEMPENIPEEIVRASDGARIQILSDTVEINRSPHSIGLGHVTEGLVLPARVTKDIFIYKGKPNAYGVGKAIEVPSEEQVPLVVIARQNDGGAWLDCDLSIQAADSTDLDGKKVHFAKFEEFEGAMTLPTVSRLLQREHMYAGAPIDAFKALKVELGRVLEIDECAQSAIALWVAMTYVFDAFESYPYLWFNGVKGSGKSTALEFIHQIGYHAILGHKITNAALFRMVHQHKSVVCYDEAENLLVGGADKSVDQDRVSLFNSGYQSTGKVIITEKEGDNYRTRVFSSYSPKALASIQPIEETLQSRCLLISMLTAIEDKPIIDSAKCDEIRRSLYDFRFREGPAFYDRVRDSKTDMEMRKKYDLRNREWEIFKPLLLGAEVICPEWLPQLEQFIADQQVIRQVDNQLSTDAIVLLKLLEVIDEGENAPDDAQTCITYKEFMSSLKDDFPELKWMTTRSIGNCLRRLGLVKLTTRYGKGYVIRFNKELVQSQIKRLGLEDVKAPVRQEGLMKYDQGANP